MVLSFNRDDPFLILDYDIPYHDLVWLFFCMSKTSNYIIDSIFEVEMIFCDMIIHSPTMTIYTWGLLDYHISYLWH